MNQGAGKKRGSTPDKDIRGQASSPPRGWSVKFYALAVSVFVHVVALSVFAAVKLSQPKAEPSNTAAVVSITQAAALAHRDAVIPKPKISEPVKSRPFDISAIPAANTARGIPIIKTSGQERPANIQPLADISKQDYGRPEQTGEPAEQPAGAELLPATGSETSPTGTEFFGSASVGRRICYVVDCSGSMQGLWERVKAELADSIGQLQQDQYFCIIVFGAGSILETNGGKMARATEKVKNESYNFLNSLNPAGSTNALTAIQQAIKVQDVTGQPPNVIYFLTDGFELSEQDGLRFAHQVITMMRSFAPKTQINTIGLWPSQTDKRTLETIANQSGGKFTLIGETDSASSPQAGEK